MRTAFVLAALFAGAAVAADPDRALTVTTQRGVPPVESVAVYQTKNGTRAAVVERGELAKPLALPNDGPFEVWAKPKGGRAVKVLDKLEVKAGAPHELKLGTVLGSVEVFGDNFPRAAKVVVTDTRDPGPGEKGHVAVQEATDYRVDMAVPAGTYAVWVVPANGAKAQRVEDNVRVQAGRSTRVGG